MYSFITESTIHTASAFGGGVLFVCLSICCVHSVTWELIRIPLYHYITLHWTVYASFPSCFPPLPTGFLLLSRESSFFSSLANWESSPLSRPGTNTYDLNSISWCSGTYLPNSSNENYLLPSLLSFCYGSKFSFLFWTVSICYFSLLFVSCYVQGFCNIHISIFYSASGDSLTLYYCSIKCWINTCDIMECMEKFEIHLGKQSIGTGTNSKGALP